MTMAKPQPRYDLYIPELDNTDAPPFHVYRFVDTRGGPGQLPYAAPEGHLWLTTIPRHDVESATAWATWYVQGPPDAPIATGVPCEHGQTFCAWDGQPHDATQCEEYP